MEGSMKTIAEWALDFVKKGWPVLPLHFPQGQGQCSCGKLDCSSAAKHPMTKNGLKNASNGQATVLNWWREAPKANIGILTGSESGLVVLDIDPRHKGDQSLEKLQQQYGKLPQTLTVQTGGNGWHFYFKHPGGKINNKANIKPGVDLRGDGGYIVAPPSVHSSLASYMWLDPNAELAPLPDWLLQLIQSPKKSVATQSTQKTIQEGGRNASLMSIAGFLKSKGLEGPAIKSALEAFNTSLCNPPLPVSEIAQISASIRKYEEKDWTKPTELPSKAFAPELNPELLPDILRNWCQDISERMQVSLEFTAGPAVVTIASLIGRKVSILPKSKDNWQVTPNIWGCLIAPPGSMKSPTMSAILKPLQDLAVKAREEFVEENKRIEAEKTVAKAELDALKDALKSAVKSGSKEKVGEKKQALEEALRKFEESYERAEKRYMLNDPTIEKLLTILQENPQGLLLYRDELSGWMESMYKSGREGDREFFLESWNGDSPYSMDRIGRGSVFVDGLCLSILGGLQPTKFESYVASLVKGGKSDDGLLQRFQILLHPEKRTTWERVDREPDHEAIGRVQNLFSKLAKIPNPKRTEDGIDRPKLKFSASAQSMFDNWYEGLEMRLISEKYSPIYENHLSKFRSLMPSLALVFELISKVSEEFPEEVSEESVKLAIKWCEYLELHAKKAYGEFLNPDVAGARRLLEKIKQAAVKDYDRCRDIYRFGWKNLSSQAEMDKALRVLKEFGWVRTEMISPPTGRRFEVIRLHPDLRLV